MSETKKKAKKSEVSAAKNQRDSINEQEASRRSQAERILRVPTVDEMIAEWEARR